jgi:hypothetical protein
MIGPFGRGGTTQMNAKRFLGFVSAAVLLASSEVAWAQENGYGETGGDGECEGDDCRVEGGGRGSGDREGLPLELSLEADGGLPAILDQLEEEIEGYFGAYDSEDAGWPMTNTRSFDASVGGGLDLAFCLREEGDALDLVGVSHPGVGLSAKIRKVSETATGEPEGDAYIEIRLNYTGSGGEGFLHIETYEDQTPTQVNAAIAAALENAGYTFTSGPLYFNITAGPSGDLNQVSFKSTDRGITMGEVALQSNPLAPTACP